MFSSVNNNNDLIEKSLINNCFMSVDFRHIDRGLGRRAVSVGGAKLVPEHAINHTRDATRVFFWHVSSPPTWCLVNFSSINYEVYCGNRGDHCGSGQSSICAVGLVAVVVEPYHDTVKRSCNAIEPRDVSKSTKTRFSISATNDGSAATAIHSTATSVALQSTKSAIRATKSSTCRWGTGILSAESMESSTPARELSSKRANIHAACTLSGRKSTSGSSSARTAISEHAIDATWRWTRSVYDITILNDTIRFELKQLNKCHKRFVYYY
jgi:hypothetical protein